MSAMEIAGWIAAYLFVGGFVVELMCSEPEYGPKLFMVLTWPFQGIIGLGMGAARIVGRR